MHLHVLQISGQTTLKPCIENVPDSSQCAEFADSCTNPDRLVLCQRYCGACDDRDVTTQRSTQQCKDSSIICPLRLSNDLNFCRATQNRNSCPETCGLCVSSTRLPTTSSTKKSRSTALRMTTETNTRPTILHTPIQECKDVGDYTYCTLMAIGLINSTEPDLCSTTEYGNLCRKSCGLCVSSTQSLIRSTTWKPITKSTPKLVRSTTMSAPTTILPASLTRPRSTKPAPVTSNASCRDELSAALCRHLSKKQDGLFCAEPNKPFAKACAKTCGFCT